MRVSDKLKWLAKQQGTNPTRLAEELGKGVSTMHEWFAGPSTPDLASALWLAARLNVPIEFLANDSLEKPPPPAISEDERRIINYIRVAGIPLEHVHAGLVEAKRAAQAEGALLPKKPLLIDTVVAIPALPVRPEDVHSKTPAKFAYTKPPVQADARKPVPGPVEPGRAGHNLGTTGEPAIREASLVPPPKKPPEKPKPTPGERENDQRKPGTKRRKDGE